MEYTILPIILGIVMYFFITVFISLGAFIFKIKVIKTGDLSRFNNYEIVNELGNPSNIINEGNNIIYVYLKSFGNYLLKIEYNEEGQFLRINQQLDQTTSGPKGLLYKLILKII